MIRSYPNVYALGHKAIEKIFDAAVLVEEKIDGSQFSFGVFDGELQCRSKSKELVLSAPEKMFERAVEVAIGLEPLLTPGWVYRAEYLENPKHNAITYFRIPTKHLMIFDVSPGLESYLSPSEKMAEASRLGLETVPVIFIGKVDSFKDFEAFLETESILGGSKVEGLVIKNYDVFTPDKKVAMGKYVREDFKELNAKEWGQSNPSRPDLLEALIRRYKTEARWAKAVQHLRELGKLEGSPRDIGPLIKEAPADVLKECKEEITEELFNYFWPKIQRAITGGLPEWYKRELAKTAFTES